MGQIQNAINTALSGTAFLLNQSGALDEVKARTQTKADLKAQAERTEAKRKGMTEMFDGIVDDNTKADISYKELKKSEDERIGIMEQSGSRKYRKMGAYQRGDYEASEVIGAEIARLDMLESLKQRAAVKRNTKKAKDPYKRPMSAEPFVDTEKEAGLYGGND